MTPKDEVRAVLDKFSKANDGVSFKNKFYDILKEQVHNEGTFLSRRNKAKSSDPSTRQTRPRTQQMATLNRQRTIQDQSQISGVNQGGATLETDSLVLPQTNGTDESVLLDSVVKVTTKRKTTPMVQFHVLSGKFDEEKKLEPLKCGRVDDIKRTYEKQLQKLNRMGVDMT